MSLTKEDLIEERSIVIDVLEAVVLPRLGALEDDAEILKADVAELQKDMREVKSALGSLSDRSDYDGKRYKDIYYMIADLQKAQNLGQKFNKLTRGVKTP